MRQSKIAQLKFYNGLSHFIDKDRIIKFEEKSLIDRFFSGRDVSTETMIEELGPIAVHYANVQPWAEEIPDIDTRSARTFSIWAEDKRTKEIVTTVRGFYILMPFHWGKETLQEYYSFSENVPYYPMVVISSFLSIFSEENLLDQLIERVKAELQKNWQNLRQRMIETLKKTDLWKRFVLSFDSIIYFSFLCSTSDRELVKALRKNDCRITGILQMLASPTPSYDEAMITSHLNGAKKVLKEADTDG
ncbi:MAG: hypothetical protein ACW98F_18090 [Candidatus Hodarchaeales archaeon]|jgi:hypothetical protein